MRPPRARTALAVTAAAGLAVGVSATTAPAQAAPSTTLVVSEA